MTLVKTIDALLPQTQCGECGYAGCRPYAEALAAGQVAIDRCPPGGVKTLKALGRLLAIDETPYLEAMSENTRAPSVAVIEESECIGCTKCIQACPVDAIIGSGRLMHTVLPHECTGCGLCLAPCPVDCIEMTALDEPAYDPGVARSRYQARQIRLATEAHEKQARYQTKRRLSKENTMSQGQQDDKAAKKAFIEAALLRVKAKQSKA